MSNDFSNVINYYDERLLCAEQEHRKVGWGSRESQEKRYAVLVEIGLSDGDSILDVGCGLGDLYGYIKNSFPNIRYTGIDINSNAISIARKKYPDANFELVNLAAESKNYCFDHVFSSGAMSVPIDKQDDHIFLMLSRMYEIASKSVAVNFLSVYADRIDPCLYYIDPKKLLEICLKLSRKVTIRHDYFTHDVTAYIFK